MFSAREIQLMKRLGLELDYFSLSDDDLVKIEETVGDFYTQESQKTDGAMEILLLCEDILDKL